MTMQPRENYSSEFRFKEPNQPNRTPRVPSCLCSRLTQVAAAQRWNVAATEVTMRPAASGLLPVPVKPHASVG